MEETLREIVNVVMQWLALYGLKILGAGVILLLGWWISRGLGRGFGRMLAKTRLDRALVSFTGNLAKYALWVVVLIAALNQLGFQTTSLITALGAASLAVALSLQGQLSAVAAGVLILVFRPFTLGDFIEAAGAMGTVEEMTLVYTRLTTVDGRAVMMPNNKLFGDQVINYSTNPRRRIDLAVGVGYGDDLPRAKAALLGVLAADSRVLADPAPAVYVTDLADSSVNLTARAWVARGDYWDARCELLEASKAALDQAGVNIPYPQQDVHLFPAA
ncbi:MAG: mechanosensitive ion channel [Deltaproteobacteria bacterium]|nr:mechanosensitive ion channel [Deltaproteobacteria bacterium]